jgi:hypothetical protein
MTRPPSPRSLHARAVEAASALGVLAILSLSLVLAPVAGASTNFTWSGQANKPVPKWSEAANWTPATAPASSASIGALSFPALAGKGLSCTFPGPEGGCGYASNNDVSALSVESMSIDDGEDYAISGEPITLGSGGLSAAPAAVTSKLTISELALPVVLGASQTWSIGGEGSGHLLQNDLNLSGNLTGSGSALTIDMSGGPALFLENETEVGSVAIDGANTAQAGILNGAVELFGGALNSSDKNPVSLRHIFLTGTGAVGPLTSEAAELAVGSDAYPAEGIEAASVKLDSASHLGFQISGAGASAQKDYSQLTAHGALELSNATFEVVLRPPEKGKPCPTLLPGQTYTFLSTTGTLSGSFANAPEGGPEIPIRFAAACSQLSQTMRIAYHESAGAATVTGTVEAETKEKQQAKEGQEAKERQEASERQRAKEAQEARERQEGNERQQTREAEASKSEEAALAAFTKHREEEAAASHKREEEAAPKRKKEAEPPATGSMSFAGSTVTVQSNGVALVKLNCLGIASCHGKLTITEKSPVRAKGKIRARKVTIGTRTFSIAGDETKTVKIKLNTTGRALLSTDHGRLNASLALLELAPSPKNTQVKTVHLVQQQSHGRSKH